MLSVRVQQGSFDVGAETAALTAACDGSGAIASFLGIVRSTAERPVAALTLEHYPGMTERALTRIAEAAMARFKLLGCTVIHRVGILQPGEPIVLVLAAARHRRAALGAVGFLIDWLKTDAPFWKKEHLPGGETVWVAARHEDEAAASAWVKKEGLLS